MSIALDSAGINIYNIHTDHLNTPRLVVGSVNPGARWRWDPDPFGVGVPNNNPTGAGVFDFNLRFPGQIYISETGLYYNYFRDYDPAVGKYIESDPIGLAGGLNSYSYASANPLSFVDPHGKNALVIDVGIGLIGIYWEREAYGDWYFETFSTKSYMVGINVIAYAMAH